MSKNQSSGWSCEQRWDVLRNQDGFLEFEVSFQIKSNASVSFNALMMHCLADDFSSAVEKYCGFLRTESSDKDVRE